MDPRKDVVRGFLTLVGMTGPVIPMRSEESHGYEIQGVLFCNIVIQTIIFCKLPNKTKNQMSFQEALKKMKVFIIIPLVFLFCACHKSTNWTKEKIALKCNGRIESQFDASLKPDSLRAFDSNEIRDFHNKKILLNCNHMYYYSLIKGIEDCFVVRAIISDTILYTLIQFKNNQLREVYTLSLYYKMSDNSGFNRTENTSKINGEYIKTNFKTVTNTYNAKESDSLCFYQKGNVYNITDGSLPKGVKFNWSIPFLKSISEPVTNEKYTDEIYKDTNKDEFQFIIKSLREYFSITTDFKITILGYLQSNSHYLIIKATSSSVKWVKLFTIDTVECRPYEVMTLNSVTKNGSQYAVCVSEISGKYVRIKHIISKESYYDWDYNKNENDSIYYISEKGAINISNRETCPELDTSKSVFYLLNDSMGVYRHINEKDTSMLLTDRNGYVPCTMQAIKIYGAHGGPCYSDSDNQINYYACRLNVLNGLLLDTNNVMNGHKLNHFILTDIRNGFDKYYYMLSCTKKGKLLSLVEVSHNVSGGYCHSDRNFEIVPSSTNALKLKITDSWTMRNPNLEGQSEGMIIIKDNGDFIRKIIKESERNR